LTIAVSGGFGLLQDSKMQRQKKETKKRVKKPLLLIVNQILWW
jgi:hypothetical protein